MASDGQAERTIRHLARRLVIWVIIGLEFLLTPCDRLSFGLSALLRFLREARGNASRTESGASVESRELRENRPRERPQASRSSEPSLPRVPSARS